MSAPRYGIPKGQTPKDEAFIRYCLDVLAEVERLFGKDNPEATQAENVMRIHQHKNWIAIQQTQAFENAATATECAKWIHKNLTDPRLRQ